MAVGRTLLGVGGVVIQFFVAVIAVIAVIVLVVRRPLSTTIDDRGELGRSQRQSSRRHDDGRKRVTTTPNPCPPPARPRVPLIDVSSSIIATMLARVCRERSFF